MVVVLPEVIVCACTPGYHVTGPGRRSRDRKRPRPEEIAYACGTGKFSTTTIVVVQNVSLRMTDRATGSDVTWKGFPWVCAFPTGSCAIYALVGPFDRK